MPDDTEQREEEQSQIELKPPEREGDRDHLIGALAAALIAIAQQRQKEAQEQDRLEPEK